MSSGNGDHRFGERMAFSGGMEDTPTVCIGHVADYHYRSGKSARMVTFMEGNNVLVSVSLETLKEIVKWVSCEDNTK